MEAPMSPSVPATGANRLSIAHLLLWTTMTALVLMFVRAVYAPGVMPPELDDALRINIERQSQLQMSVLLVFSPAYGAALSSLCLTAWRLATRRFGFPTQPGHWLLLMVAVFPLSVGVARQLHPRMTGQVVIIFFALASL